MKLSDRMQLIADDETTEANINTTLSVYAAEVRKLEAVADVMSSDDALFITDVLTTATNSHGVNQTYNNDPYYLTKLAKDLECALAVLEAE